MHRAGLQGVSACQAALQDVPGYGAELQDVPGYGAELQDVPGYGAELRDACAVWKLVSIFSERNFATWGFACENS